MFADEILNERISANPLGEAILPPAFIHFLKCLYVMIYYWTKPNRKHTKWIFFLALCYRDERERLLCIYTVYILNSLKRTCQTTTTYVLRQASKLIELRKQLPNGACWKLGDPGSGGNTLRLFSNFPVTIKPLQKQTSADCAMKWNHALRITLLTAKQDKKEKY